MHAIVLINTFEKQTPNTFASIPLAEAIGKDSSNVRKEQTFISQVSIEILPNNNSNIDYQHKQPIVTKSSTEAELVGMSDVCSEVISLRNFVIAQGQPVAPAIVLQDNNSAMALVDRGGPCSKRSRHIDIRHFWVAEKVNDGSVKIVRCPTEVMWANILTKPLGRTQFVAEREGLTNCWNMC